MDKIDIKIDRFILALSSLRSILFLYAEFHVNTVLRRQHFLDR